MKRGIFNVNCKVFFPAAPLRGTEIFAAPPRERKIKPAAAFRFRAPAQESKPYELHTFGLMTSKSSTFLGLVLVLSFRECVIVNMMHNIWWPFSMGKKTSKVHDKFCNGPYKLRVTLRLSVSI